MNESGEGIDKSVGTTEPESPAKDTATIISWNIWHKADPQAVLSHLQEIITKEKEEQGRDVGVVMLQEFNAAYAEQFAEALGMHHKIITHARHLQFRGKDYGAGDDLIILSKLPFEEEVKKKLVTDAYRLGFKEKEEVQSENYLQIDIPLANGKKLRVGNVHLLPHLVTKPRKRREEGLKLANIAEANIDVPILISGDFNAEPRSFAAQKIQGSAQRPLLKPAREPGTPTWSGKHWKTMGPLGRFIRREYDQTYVSDKVKVLSSKVYDAGPSDHHPTVTEVQVL